VAVAADLLVGDAPLASPELALVDAELAAELRRTLSPIEDRWKRPPPPVEDVSAESEEHAPAQLDSADDAEAELGDAEHLDDPGLSSPDVEKDDLEGSTLHRSNRVENAPGATEGGASASDQWSMEDERREVVGDDEPLLVDDDINTPDPTRAEEEQTRSHYPALPAPEPDAEATDDTDAAFRRIRERLRDADKAPSHKRRLRRGFTLASGVVAACTVAALGANVQLQLAQLPSWLQL
jgi:hypothetical protein